MREVEARRFAVPASPARSAVCARRSPSRAHRLVYAPSPSRSLEVTDTEVTTRVPDSLNAFAGRAVEAARGYYQEQFPTTQGGSL